MNIPLNRSQKIQLLNDISLGKIKISDLKLKNNKFKLFEINGNVVTIVEDMNAQGRGVIEKQITIEEFKFIEKDLLANDFIKRQITSANCYLIAFSHKDIYLRDEKGLITHQ